MSDPTTCDACEGRGYLWPQFPDGDTSWPYVEKCDQCGLFPDDMTAARALAKEHSGDLCVVFDSHDSEYYRPFFFIDDVRKAWDSLAGEWRDVSEYWFQPG